MVYKQEMKMLAIDIVKSKGYHVWENWKNPNLGKKRTVGNLVNSINSKIRVINEVPVVNKVETTVEPLFVQLQFEF